MLQQKYRALARVPLLDRTPFIRLERLGAALGGINLYIKRDDMGALGGGGNKLRKLEFLLPPAIEQGCDTLITFGALQSNHARLTAAAAARFGMKCHLILNRKVPRTGPHYEAGGNLVLDTLFGAQLHVLPGEDDPLAYCERLKGELAAQGRKPWVIPFGGTDALGAMGHVACIEEIMDQAREQGVDIDYLVHASGSGGTQAGLLLGALVHGAEFPILGVSVLHPAQQLHTLVSNVLADAAALLDTPLTGRMRVPKVDDRYIGRGYGLMHDTTRQALSLAAATEGILLDPVYTGKAFAGLVGRVREGDFRKGDTVVFLHTGGIPGIFAYSDELLDAAQPGAPA
ncbi:D-cysteine desulfhydrase family protein [Orrella sp. JC864]|uniref:D-cysteine desulfhydrase family protein n=1 Tax=Orrella sp. JC864 TaxID=3120298 RepID=UPI0012BC176C